MSASKQARVKAEVRKLKEATPCKDCARRFPHYVMDYDHRPGSTKVASVANMVRIKGREQVLLEIDKCDLVCSNCHRERTHQKSTLGVVI